jgi:2-methylcitrate dehydratase PrpD
MSARHPSLSEQLASFVAHTRYEDLPEQVIHKAKRHIIDTFGAALAGTASVESHTVRKLLSGNTEGSASVWGTPLMVNPRDGAFINGVAAHALELDDSGGCDHSGAVVLPAALSAIAHSNRPVSGREFITSIVLGYDVGRRVLEACGGYSLHNGQGWHSTMTCGVFGAAVASARLLGLDSRQTSAAIGHAASFSGGLWGFIHDASQTKRMHTGRAAEGGILAAMLAEQGITGPTQVFSDVWGGFFNAFAHDTQQPEVLLAELGVNWKIMRCSIKPHASCRSTHAAVDATLDLTNTSSFSWNQVKSVHVRLSSFVNNMCGGRDLANLASAQMSLPYAIAAVLVFGNASISSYLEAQRSDPRIAEVMSKIELNVDSSMSDLDEPEVTLLKSGESPQSKQVIIPLGDPQNPVSDEQLLDKFHALAGMVLNDKSVNLIAKSVMQLEEITDVRVLVRILSGSTETRTVLR